MERIKAGIIGVGFIGISHIDAIRRIGYIELAAIADENYSLAKQKAMEYGVQKCYSQIDELINDPEIKVIHNCTPNHLHLEINEKIIKAGKHVFSEKPLGKNVKETQQMLELLREHPDIVAGVNFCYRMNPLMLDMKERIKKGEIGKPLLVHGCYLQDWLLYDTDYNWRLESRYAGASRCVADIGTHWMDLAQNALGSRIVEVCANTLIAHPIRRKSLIQTETFQKAAGDEFEEMKVDTEDYASVMVKFEDGVTGVFQCSQISAGRKCHISFEVNGSVSSFQWQQETSDQMWKGNRDSNNELIMRNPSFMDPGIKDYTYLPAGHPEGWNDALKNNIAAFYQFIKTGKRQSESACDFATFEEGHYLVRLTEAIMKSSRERRWVSVDEIY